MNRVTCTFGVERLMDYLEGTAPDEVRRAIEGHVAQCARCTAFIASYCETPRIFRNATDRTLPLERQVALQAFLRSRRGRGSASTDT
jgi:anti-sigma factor RsiW